MNAILGAAGGNICRQLRRSAGAMMTIRRIRLTNSSRLDLSLRRFLADQALEAWLERARASFLLVVLRTDARVQLPS